jgi:pimeloyl-ACP methyl ester carboxylesterase
VRVRAGRRGCLCRAERGVPAPGGDLHVIEQPGCTEPAVVLMHGFPDDWRIYRKLIPHLAPRRAVTFDFLGYGHSGRPERPDPGQHLNPGVARHLAGLFSHADLHLIDDAAHWPQADQPAAVAQILEDAR